MGTISDTALAPIRTIQAAGGNTPTRATASPSISTSASTSTFTMESAATDGGKASDFKLTRVSVLSGDHSLDRIHTDKRPERNP